MAARGFLGSGDIYINRKVNGVAQGLLGPYIADKFEIKPNVDKKELISKGRSSYGQVLESVSIQKPADFTLDMSEVNRESMTMALLGNQATRTQSSGTLTAESITAKLGVWAELSKQALSGAMIVTNSGASTTYVEGTDYEVNRQLGWIRALADGDITDAETLKVSGAYSAIAGTVISGATKVDIRAEIIFDGINQADGLPTIVRVWEAVIAADSAFDFLADDFNTVSLKGTMKTPTGKGEPFTVELRNA